jgi:hypothetical protein
MNVQKEKERTWGAVGPMDTRQARKKEAARRSIPRGHTIIFQKISRMLGVGASLFTYNSACRNYTRSYHICEMLLLRFGRLIASSKWALSGTPFLPKGKP